MVMASTQSLSCNNTIIRNKKLGFNKVIRPTKDKQGIYTPFFRYTIHLTLATVEPNLNGSEGNQSKLGLLKTQFYTFALCYVFSLASSTLLVELKQKLEKYLHTITQPHNFQALYLFNNLTFSVLSLLHFINLKCAKKLKIFLTNLETRVSQISISIFDSPYLKINDPKLILLLAQHNISANYHIMKYHQN